VVWDAAIEVWCVPAPRRSGLSPAGFVLRDDDHCVSLRVFASSRETNAVVCPRLRPISGRFVPVPKTTAFLFASSRLRVRRTRWCVPGLDDTRFGRQQEAWWEVGSAPVVMRGA